MGYIGGVPGSLWPGSQPTRPHATPQETKDQSLKLRGMGETWVTSLPLGAVDQTTWMGGQGTPWLTSQAYIKGACLGVPVLQTLAVSPLLYLLLPRTAL
jgi:hypothetical protein